MPASPTSMRSTGPLSSTDRLAGGGRLHELWATVLVRADVMRRAEQVEHRLLEARAVAGRQGDGWQGRRELDGDAFEVEVDDAVVDVGRPSHGRGVVQVCSDAFDRFPDVAVLGRPAPVLHVVR